MPTTNVDMFIPSFVWEAHYYIAGFGVLCTTKPDGRFHAPTR